jgi:hypothetical protein
LFPEYQALDTEESVEIGTELPLSMFADFDNMSIGSEEPELYQASDGRVLFAF